MERKTSGKCCLLLLGIVFSAQVSLGAGNPILLVGTSSNQFSFYSSEILRSEGLNAFDSADISTVTASTLSAYDVVVLGQATLTSAQVTMFANWVETGGNLIALRPDPQLASLLGINHTGNTLSNGYLLVNTAAAPGAGIVDQTIQFHGTADLYVPNGAMTVATLYSSASAATPYPAVTLRTGIGADGNAAAFTYDLARSVVYTRQGNPAWIGQARIGQGGPIRAADMFYGNADFDPQPDWVDLNKVAIPQADEQQRLLANLILHLNRAKRPLPRFWYFPFGKKAAVIMTGDDHAGGGTAGRFEDFIDSSPTGCSIANWECVRGTSYVYPNSPLTNSQAASYVAQGFEVALHVTTDCADYTPLSLESFFASQLSDFRSKYISVPAPSTSRTHCIPWSDWVSHPLVELNHGIRLDTDYYYWPPSWVVPTPGFFTGSGIPMRFAQADGTLIDVYQAVTQMTDESGQSYPETINGLLDNAVGPAGFYGAFTANMHTDNNGGDSQQWADEIVSAAKSRDVPVVSSKQMLQWLDSRNGSSFGSLSWSGNVLTFTITAALGANGLQAMLPTASAVGGLSSFTRGGTPVSYSVQMIKGIQYAFFSAASGTYQATYAAALPPLITALTATPGTTSATITWTTDKNSDSRVDYGVSPASLTWNALDPASVTSHRIGLTGLVVGTTYYFRVSSTDSSGNSASSPIAPATASFTTIDPNPPVISAVAAAPDVNGRAVITWATNKLSDSRVEYGTSTALGTTVSDASMVTAHSISLAGLAQGTTYYYRVTSVDALGNSASSPLVPATASFVENGLSIWSPSTIPGSADADSNAVELGMKFRSDVAGMVTGVRFYKATANTGTHSGHVWTSTGTLLGSVTFVNETASGWQQANFATPISIDANTTYIVSYLAPNGRYSANNGFFTSAGVDSPPLHALRSGIDGPNGIYRYGATGGFPDSSWEDTNYWVDLVFSATNDATPPTVTTFTMPVTAASLTVPISSFTATDNIAVAGYLVTESSAVPAPGAAGWMTAAPTSYTFADAGTKTLYAWAKDAAGNVSASRSASVTITLSDVTAPTVTAFAIPATATSLNVSISSLTATDNIAVAGYMVTESSAAPAPGATGWMATAPASYTFTTAGSKTLYAWAKDAAGNVSESRSASVVITIQASGPEPAGWYAGDMHVHRSCGGSPEAISSVHDRMATNNLAAISLLADMGNGEVQNPVTDLPLVTGQDASASTPGRIVHWDAEWHWDATYSQYAHEALGGHIVALGLSSAYQIWQEYTYPILNWAHQQNGIAGFAHMQYLDGGVPDSLDCCTPIEYPVEVALGSADFISEDVDDSGSGAAMNPDNFIQAYYRLLNAGFRPGFAAGTDYPCNSSRPVGSLLTYAQATGGQMTYRNWIDAIAKGRTVISRNGHNEFLAIAVNGTATPGDEIKMATAGSVTVTVQWSAAQNLTGTIELVSNGVVVGSNPASVAPGAPAIWTTTVSFPKSGWLAARRMGSDGHLVHTAAVFVIVNGAPVRASVSDAQFFVQWMDNLLEKTSPGGEWNSYFPTSLSQAQARYQAAKAIYQQVALEAAGGTSSPTLSAITPASGVQGTSVPVTLTGTNLTGATLNLPAGVTTAGAPVVSATQITATLVIAATATTGPQSITVTTPSGTSNSLTFTINPTVPTLTAITPASGVQGASVPVILTGTNLTGATLNLPAGVTTAAAPVVSATQITATLVIATSAATGPRSITVSTAGGTSNALTFTINPAAPTLAAVTPASGVQGASVPVTLTGTNLTGATLNLPAGVTTAGAPVVSATQIRATLVIATSAATGPRSITVSTAGGTSNALTFTINPAAPRLTAITPVSGVRGASVPVTLSGSNLTGAIVNAPVGITVTGTTATATSVTATFVIGSTAATGARAISVTTGGGTSNSVSFTIMAPSPVITSVSPTVLARGATTTVAINGLNLTSATTVRVSPTADITLGLVRFINATQITVPIRVAARAKTGNRSLSVTAGGLTSNAVTITIQ